MNWFALVISHLPKNAGECISYSDLKRKVGVIDSTYPEHSFDAFLVLLKRQGEISFGPDAESEITEEMDIIVLTQALSPDDFYHRHTGMPGRDMVGMFGYDPDKCRINMFPNGLLHITQPDVTMPHSYGIGPEQWTRVKKKAPA
jgi:hypothetical protein